MIFIFYDEFYSTVLKKHTGQANKGDVTGRLFNDRPIDITCPVRGSRLRMHTNTKNIETFPTNKFRLYFFSGENRITSMVLLKILRKFSVSQKTYTTMFAVFSDTLRGIPPKKRTCSIRTFYR